MTSSPSTTSSSRGLRDAFQPVTPTRLSRSRRGTIAEGGPRSGEDGDDSSNGRDDGEDDDDDRDALTTLPFTPRSSLHHSSARRGLGKRLSDMSLRSSAGGAGAPLPPTLDREGMVITQVGGLPLDLLQSLYLSQSLMNETGSISSGPSTPVLGYDHPTSAPILSSLNSSHSRQSSGASFRSVSFTQRSIFPPVRRLAQKDRRRILVTGGAGFVGSHLVDRLMCSGHDVVVLDNFFSGSKTSISHWVGHPNFELVRADVTEPFMVEVDQIYHLACPASPKAYQANAVKTLKTNFLGTFNMLGLAKRVKARFLLSSTSEIYGSPEQHPQHESYWGHVNPVGPRACYDEGKRVAEALTYGYHRQDGVDVRVARIFNCYGPRMNMNDGRLVSNFVVAALKGEPIRVYGDGTATRSLMFVHDLVSGLISLMDSNYVEPVNIGSEDEATVSEWAHLIRDTVAQMRRDGEIPSMLGSEGDDFGAPLGSPTFRDSQNEILGRSAEEGAVEVFGAPQGEKEKGSEIVFEEAVVDDPPRRRPDISRAREVLGWQPTWTTLAGIRECVLYFANELEGNA